MQFKKVLFYTLLATIAGFVGAFCFSKINQPHASNSVSKDESLKGILANYNGKIAEGNLSFILASKVSTPCVVFIKTTAMVQQRNPFGSFFEDCAFAVRRARPTHGRGPHDWHLPTPDATRRPQDVGGFVRTTPRGRPSHRPRG